MSLDSSQFADLRDRHQRVRDRIEVAAARARRKVEEIALVAVTKTATVDQILGLIELGQRDLGENRVQQLEDRAAKIAAALAKNAFEGSAPTPSPRSGGEGWGEGVHRKPSPAPDLQSQIPDLGPGPLAPGPLPLPRWHMIGHLQRNKVRDVVPIIALIHSVDSLRLALEIEAFGGKRGSAIDVLLQVNIADEEQKYGLAAGEVAPLAQAIAETMPHIRLRGLMTMAPYSDRAEDSRPVFAQTAAMFRDLRGKPWIGPAFNQLSMGMTNDFEVAVEEGSNVLRVGRALFEKQPK